MAKGICVVYLCTNGCECKLGKSFVILKECRGNNEVATSKLICDMIK